jgi:hypothetical protein
MDRTEEEERSRGCRGMCANMSYGTGIRSVEMVQFGMVQQEVRRGSTWTTEIASESKDYQQKHSRG